MRRNANKLYLALVTALLTVLGFGSCKTSFISKKKLSRQREAFLRDSIARAQAQQADYEAFRRDSIRKVREMEQTICIYGGPSMMDRRVKIEK